MKNVLLALFLSALSVVGADTNCVLLVSLVVPPTSPKGLAKPLETFEKEAAKYLKAQNERLPDDVAIFYIIDPTLDAEFLLRVRYKKLTIKTPFWHVDFDRKGNIIKWEKGTTE